MTALFHFLSSQQDDATRSVKFRLHLARVLVLLATIINTGGCAFSRSEVKAIEFVGLVAMWIMAGVANVTIAQAIAFLDGKTGPR